MRPVRQIGKHTTKVNSRPWSRAFTAPTTVKTELLRIRASPKAKGRSGRKYIKPIELMSSVLGVGKNY
jgi:hypothetical protein